MHHRRLARTSRLLRCPLALVVAGAGVAVTSVPPPASATSAASAWKAPSSASRRHAVPVPVANGPGAATRTGTGARDVPAAPSAYPFTAASAWRTSVVGAPVDVDSSAMVSTLTATVGDRYGGVAAFNVWDYNNSYDVADATTPRVDVLFDDCQHKGYTPDGLTGVGGQFTGVPAPSGATAAAGTDHAYSVYSPATDQLWEFWNFQKDAAGRWTACWGGRLDHTSTAVGFFSGGFGASASGLAHTGGMVTLADARSLRIDHALALAIPDVATWQTFRWPAQRSDGSSTDPHAIPEGARLRLDPSLDVAALHLHPVAAAIARAAQTYGFIVTDRSGAVAVTTESGQATKARTGTDPWVAILGSTPSYSVLQGFPWDRLQVIQDGFGRR